MSTLFSKDTKISHIITTSVERSKALEDDVRATILAILSHEVLSTKNIVKELKKAGYTMATTTVRHHIDILKNCGLIEVVRVQEARGAMLKYYASTVKFLGFENSFDSTKYNKAVKETTVKLLKIANSLFLRYGRTIRDTNSLTCPYCNIEHGMEYTVMEIMNRALAEMVQKKEFVDTIKELSRKKTKNA
ncbi:MAG: winged-helix domain-containing protein [Nitrososphaerales archaeon]